MGASSQDDNMSVEDLQEEVENEESFCRTKTQEIENFNERCNQHQSKLAELKQKANRLMEEQLRLSNNLQQRGTLKERKDALEKDLEKLCFQCDEAKNLLEPCITKQVAAESAYVEAQKTRENLLDQARKKV